MAKPVSALLGKRKLYAGYDWRCGVQQYVLFLHKDNVVLVYVLQSLQALRWYYFSITLVDVCRYSRDSEWKTGVGLQDWSFRRRVCRKNWGGHLADQ
jgi:hypothetical protein